MTDTSQTAYQPDLWMAGIKTFATLCLVIAGLVLVCYLLKRFYFAEKRSGYGPYIKMLSSYHVAPKQRVALIDVVGEKWVIGITQESITCLGKLENEESLKRIESFHGPANKGMTFQKLFSSSLKKEKTGVGGDG